MKKHLKNNPLKPTNRKSSFLLIPLVFLYFTLSPLAQAVVPAPDGGYPGGNTAEGQNALFSLTNGTYNTAVGVFSLWSNTEGNFNTGIGAGALLTNTADRNTAIGAGALLSNTAGNFNTANGAFALFTNTEGGFNTANGEGALYYNSTGGYNTATGASALFNNTEGAENTATGYQALLQNTTGSSNTADGSLTLLNNITGNDNTATGFAALDHNTTGNQNTATGSQALVVNTTGDFNTAIGAAALLRNDNGIANTAVGYQSLLNNSTGGGNTAIGENALLNNTTGVQNVALGLAAGGGITTANNVICIGSQVSGANISNSCFIGNIRDVPTGIGDAISVIIDSHGQLGTISSSRRFKKDIKPMDEASEAILALKPVAFHYKNDRTSTPQFGLIAEEVVEANPDLVVRDEKGEVYTVRYDAVNAMLLNEFLKEHKKVEELKNDFQSTVALQKKQIQALMAQLTQQAEQIRKVRAQVKTNRPATEVALKNP
jgi:trimeric autotransporter adhesin